MCKYPRIGGGGEIVKPIVVSHTAALTYIWGGGKEGGR